MDEASSVESPNPGTYARKKKLIILGIVGLLILLVVLIFIPPLILRDRQPSQLEDADHRRTSSPDQVSNFHSPGQIRQTFPKPQFVEWKGGEEPPINYVQETAVFNLKTDFTTADANVLAQHFSLTNQPIVGEFSALVKGNEEPANINRLIFNLNAGTFTYLSAAGIPLDGSGETASRVEAFIKRIYAGDTTLAYHSTYKRKSTGNDITYYVLYRDWDRTSSKKMPIFSPFGLLNLTESDTLSDLKINSTTSLPEDPDIYQTSDNTDGYARADQFNAITVSVDSRSNQAKIIAVTSNIRPLNNSTTATLGKVLSYEEALSRLKENKSNIFFITPTGDDAISWDRIFPNNIAKSNVGEIQESYMAYLEYPSFLNQSQIQPYFIFKGRAQLESGFSTRFIAAVSAIDDLNAISFRPNFSFISDVYAQTNPGQKQGTFDITPEAEVTQTPTVRETRAPSTDNCIPSPENLMFLIHPDVGLWNPPEGDNFWYYVPDPNNPPTQEEVNQIIREAMLINPNRKTPEQIFREAQYASCPIKAAFHTPSIFVYGAEGTEVIITPSSVVKVKPSLRDGSSWISRLDGRGGFEVNNWPVRYLYYEYTNVKFNRPTKGFIIDRAYAAQFVQTISDNLELNSQEEERLAYELKDAINKVSGSKLFVGLIPQTEIDTKLPLGASSNIEHIVRIHFYITSSSTIEETIEKPDIRPINRDKTLLIEIGSHTGKE